MKQVIIRRVDQAIEVSEDGVRGLDPAKVEPLYAQLTYAHVKYLYGPEAVDKSTGERHHVRVTEKRLYHFDVKNRLVTAAGFIDRVYTYFNRRGYAVGVVDERPKFRPEVLRPDWSRVDDPRYASEEVLANFSVTDDDREKFAALRASEAQVDPTDVESTSRSRKVITREVVETVLGRASSGYGTLVKLVPGAGKSFSMAVYPLVLPKARIAVVLPDVDNLNKTASHLTRYVAQVGQVGDGKNDVRRVTVFTKQSAHKIPPDTDLILFDEAHTAAEDRVSEVLLRVAPHSVRVGFTATPTGRLDNADVKVEMLFGPVKYEVCWPEATRLGLVVPIEVYWLDMAIGYDPAAKVSGFLTKKLGLWCNDERNIRIARAARRHQKGGDQVLIMVTHVEPAIRLKKFLPEFELCYGTHDLERFKKFDNRGLLDEIEDFVPMDAEIRELMRTEFAAGHLKYVIATSVWSTGVSFDQLPVLIRADGQGSPIRDEQIPGRVSRLHAPSGKRTGLVIDCDDSFNRALSTAAGKRRNSYKEKGWKQTYERGLP